MQCLRLTRSLFTPFSPTFSPPKHRPKLRFSIKSQSATMSSSSSETIEHIVLFKVKDDADLAKVNNMVSSLNGLASLDSVLHLTAGALHRARSSPIPFTHLLHSRYPTKDALNAYSLHPSHVNVVKESVLPICDDVMAVDWVADGLQGSIAPPPGSAVRFTFLKLKEGLEAGVKEEILGVIKGIKAAFGGIDQITCGANFSPARAKGYSIGSLAVFKGLGEMESVDSKEELVNLQKEKVKDYLESVIVVDYVVPAPQSANL